MRQVWNRLSYLFALAPTPRTLHAQNQAAEEQSEMDLARRWHKARNSNPELAGDLIRLGGILAAQPFVQGEVAALDTTRLAYEAGRRDMALQLLALMTLSIDDLNLLMEDPNA